MGLSHDGWKETGWFCQDVFDAEARGSAGEEFHLQEADLHMDELVNGDHFCRSEGVELFDEVGGYGKVRFGLVLPSPQADGQGVLVIAY